MRTIITLSVCILMVALSFWVVSIDEPIIEKSVSQPAFTAATADDQKSASPNADAENLESANSVQLNQNSVWVPLNSKTKIIAANAPMPTPKVVAQQLPLSAANINSLPPAMQQEIQILSGRSDAGNLITEVSPGVFLNAAGPRVVPVAVINSDGTVTTHEY